MTSFNIKDFILYIDVVKSTKSDWGINNETNSAFPKIELGGKYWYYKNMIARIEYYILHSLSEKWKYGRIVKQQAFGKIERLGIEKDAPEEALSYMLTRDFKFDWHRNPLIKTHFVECTIEKSPNGKRLKIKNECK